MGSLVDFDELDKILGEMELNNPLIIPTPDRLNKCDYTKWIRKESTNEQ